VGALPVPNVITVGYPAVKITGRYIQNSIVKFPVPTVNALELGTLRYCVLLLKLKLPPRGAGVGVMGIDPNIIPPPMIIVVPCVV